MSKCDPNAQLDPEDHIWAVADLLRAGIRLEPVVVLAESAESTGIICEGNVRATAYAMTEDLAMKNISVIWGVAPVTTDRVCG